MNVEKTPNNLSIRVAMLSALLPGLGHIYCQQRLLGMIFMLLIVFTMVPLPLLVILNIEPNFLPISIVSLLLFIFVLWAISIITSVRIFKQRRINEGGKPLWLYAIIILVFYSTMMMSNHLIKTHWVESYYIASDSMTPTLIKGDFIFVKKLAVLKMEQQDINEGDIIVFRSPEIPHRTLVKRIEAIKPIANKLNTADKSLFVLGDNQKQSRDSRHFGSIHTEQIIGKPFVIWFSIKDTNIQWNRLGKSINDS